MFSQLFSTDMKIAVILILAFLLALYVLSIIWVIRDAYSRGANWKVWGLIALIPVAGLVAYILLRPQLLLIDRDEQELEIAVKQRELLKFGECSKCGCAVLNDYLVCPNCGQQLKTACPKCGKPLDFKWKLCPWCGTPKQSTFVSNSNSAWSAKSKGNVNESVSELNSINNNDTFKRPEKNTSTTSTTK